MIQEFITTAKKYAVFTGTATRKEFWTFFLIHLAVDIVLYALIGLTARTPLMFIPLLALLVWAFGLLVPYYAVMVRRLHDTAKSGWWILIAFVPFGGIVLLVFLAQPTNLGPNKYATDLPVGAVFS